MGFDFAGLSRVLLALMLSNAFCSVLLAGIRPSFMLDQSSWRATNIVSVLSTPEDGVFEVAESWKGDLHPRDHVTVPELAPDRNAVSISSYPKQTSILDDASGPSLQIPRQPPGSRMVLFLKRGRSTGPERRVEWSPSNVFDDFKTSVVWIDGERVYAFRQLMNPGPSALEFLDVSESNLKARVAEVVSIQADLEDAAKVEDGFARAMRLKSYVHSDVLPARQFALDELGRSGPSAVETIRGMLHNDDFAADVPELLEVYAKAGGEALGEDLNTRLQEKLGFWRAMGSTLPRGWWNEIGMPDREAFQRQYMETYQLVVALQKIDYPPALPTARELSAFWKSVPQLNDPSGLNRMSEESDRLIEHLSR
jgi:hypothetical protein